MSTPMPTRRQPTSVATESRLSVTSARPGSPELAAVRALWRQHSDTLGFFPDGAFAHYAERGCVLIATNVEDEVIGYLVYRVARGRAVIIHLCCDEAHRGRGIARRLFLAFRERTEDLVGARLTCRSDFAASAIWPRLGFVRIGERPAREPGKILGLWSLEYGHPDLFSAHAAEVSVAVIDANVFFDLASRDEAASRSVEARALQADWLQSSFLLAITPELHNEIARNRSAAARGRLRHLASSFHCVSARPREVDAAYKAVAEMLGAATCPSEESDRRQLAFAVAARADMFLTYDGELLGRADALQDAFGIRVLRPVDLINDIEISAHPWAYQPGRLEGSELSARNVRTEDISAIKSAFLYFGQQEAATALTVTLRQILAQPRKCTAQLVADGAGALLGLVAIDWSDDARPRIRLLRVRRHGLSATLARHLLWSTVAEAVRKGATAVAFEDPMSDELIREALGSVGFVPDRAGWTKIILQGCLSIDASREHLADHVSFGNLPSTVRVSLDETLRALDGAAAADIVRLEHLLWPLKVRTDALPCYIVPIRPVYASQLFDTTMASESLFDASSDLLLRLENVYYRAPQFVLEAPARILWYVSDEKGYSRAKHVSAASALKNTFVGPPKTVFKQLRRFGVYRYADVKRIADRNRRGDVMAFTFAQTEVFRSPVPLAKVRQALLRHIGRVHPLLSPVCIPPAAWYELYEAGAQGET